MRRLAGLTISQAEYSQWESGSRVPRPDNPKVERLYEFFGSRPDEEKTPAPEGSEGLVAALTRQAEAIERQAEAITALTQEIRMAALSVLSGQQGTGELLAELVSAAESGRLGELLTELRAGSVPEAPGR